MTKEILELQGALLATGLVQPITMGGKAGSVDALCRLVPGQDKPWLKVVGTLLEKAEEASIDVHVCKQFLRKDGQMVSGWFLSIRTRSAKSLKKAIETLTPAFEAAKPVLVPVGQEQQPVRYAPPPDQHATQAPRPTAGPPAPYKPPPYAHLTEARARPPMEPGKDLKIPEGTPKPMIKVVESQLDDNGRPRVVQIMPLPHIYRDLNKPNELGKGAWAGGSFRPPRRRE